MELEYNKTSITVVHLITETPVFRQSKYTHIESLTITTTTPVISNYPYLTRSFGLSYTPLLTTLYRSSLHSEIHDNVI